MQNHSTPSENQERDRGLDGTKFQAKIEHVADRVIEIVLVSTTTAVIIILSLGGI